MGFYRGKLIFQRRLEVLSSIQISWDERMQASATVSTSQVYCQVWYIPLKLRDALVAESCTWKALRKGTLVGVLEEMLLLNKASLVTL